MSYNSCEICGKKFETNKYNPKQRYCSRECRKEGWKRYMRQKANDWWKKHPDAYLKNKQDAYSRDKNRRMECLIHYGGNPPKCACCEESHFEFLTLDHINGKGSKERKQFGGYSLFKFLIENGFPEGYQVLCSNCNMGKGRNEQRFCPIHHPECY